MCSTVMRLTTRELPALASSFFVAVSCLQSLTYSRLCSTGTVCSADGGVMQPRSNKAEQVQVLHAVGNEQVLKCMQNLSNWAGARRGQSSVPAAQSHGISSLP